MFLPLTLQAYAAESFNIPDNASARTLDGGMASLSDHHGKLVFLNIWRTDCIACLIEIPLLNRLQKEYSSENFTVIGVAMDRDKDSAVKDLVQRVQISYPVWLGYGQPLGKYLNVPVLPFLLAIGPDGKVIGHVVGAFRTYEEAVAAMKRAQSALGETGGQS